MREIKFRGKRLDNGEWVHGYFVKARDNTCHIIAEFGSDITCCSDCGANDITVYEVDPSTVGQYTGKKVKTGEVFQDDIGKSIDGLFLVAWDEEKAAFVMHFYDYPKETLYLEEMWDDAEIIGNLHDNPELLEE